MINRDPNFDISTKIAAVQYDTLVRQEESKHDILLLDELVDAVNQQGYYIQYYFQLQTFSIEDRKIYPLIKQYINRFDNPDFSISLLGYLGVPKLYEATEFLLDVFSQPNKKKFENAYMSTRQSSSSSLLRIKDKRYQNEYRLLISSKDTHNDSCFLVELLGFFVSQENYTFLVELLKDECAAIRSHAVLALSKYKEYAPLLKPVFEQLVIEDSNNAVKEYALKALRKWSK